MGPRTGALALALALATAFACATDPSAPAEPRGCPAPLEGAIERAALEGVLADLAGIADASGGNRAAATTGYQRSADRVVERLEAAGYAVTREPFGYVDFELVTPPLAAITEPAPRDLVLDEDYRVARWSGDGDLTAPVVPIAIEPGPGNQSTSGCAAEDFAALPAGAIALVQRGGCSFATKADNAIAAGAGAIIFFNQGDIDTRTGLFLARIDPDAPIPAIAVGYALGLELAEPGAVLRLAVDGRSVDRVTENILAESAPTPSGRVIMVGAHLDSVIAGPGINDNGSGVAAVLELALQLRPCDLRHQVRLAFWGGEELGLLGSDYHVGALDEDARAAIALYLNLDMIGSPNPVRFLYDGDGSAFDDAGPPGSDAIEAALAAYYEGRGLPSSETPFDGRSDYGPFIAAEIPAGGIFTGAEGLKSPDETAAFGGAAEAPYDPCYHAACDGLANVDLDELHLNAQAAAHVIEGFAMADDPLPTAPRASRRPAQARPRATTRAAHDHAHDHDHEGVRE